MIERIVVPLDGSLTAERILPHVRRLLYRHDSEVILVKAVEPPPVEASMTLAEAQMGAARDYILGQEERLARSGVRVSHVIEIGYPTTLILETAEKVKATMIAMATHGSSGVKRFLFGSVAENVIRHSPVPVLLARPFWSYELTPAAHPEFAPIRKILLPVDGSDRALKAVPGITELASLFESQAVLLEVIEPKKRQAPSEGEAAEAKKHLSGVAQSIEKRGVKTTILIGRGDPVEEILEAVKSQNIDLIAMATHGRTGLSRAVTGSVTEQVLRKASVPILVTRSVEPSAAPARKGKAIPLAKRVHR